MAGFHAGDLFKKDAPMNNPNKALWEKRRLYAHWGEHARERRGIC
jgi:hypothetical protein